MSRIADAPVAILEFAVSQLQNRQDLADALAVSLDELPFRIWDAPPDQNAAEPYVILSVSEPRDVNTVPMVEVMVAGELTAKVVGRAEAYEPLRPAYVAVHQGLQGRASVPLNGGGMALTCRRLRSIAYPETVNGVEYRHLGGTYEVFAQ